jgi:RNA polymerase sigma-70 factor (ECF subfamily)
MESAVAGSGRRRIGTGEMRVAEIRQADDARLVAAALDGSEAAFGELVRRYTDLLYRHAARMTGRVDEAEDVVQAAFVKAWRGLRHCRDPEHFGAWLFRIGANAAKDHLKARRRDGPDPESLPALADGSPDPEEDMRNRNLAEEIERALARLPDEQREAFVLKHLEGRSYPEMSEMLGASVPALKMRVHRARDELQTLLEAVRR